MRARRQAVEQHVHLHLLVRAGSQRHGKTWAGARVEWCAYRLAREPSCSAARSRRQRKNEGCCVPRGPGHAASRSPPPRLCHCGSCCAGPTSWSPLHLARVRRLDAADSRSAAGPILDGCPCMSLHGPPTGCKSRRTSTNGGAPVSSLSWTRDHNVLSPPPAGLPGPFPRPPHSCCSPLRSFSAHPDSPHHGRDHPC